MNQPTSPRTRYFDKVTLVTVSIVLGFLGLIALTGLFSRPVAYILLFGYFFVLILIVFTLLVTFREENNDQKFILWALPGVYAFFLFGMLETGYLASNAGSAAFFSALGLFGLSAILEGLYRLMGWISRVKAARNELPNATTEPHTGEAALPAPIQDSGAEDDSTAAAPAPDNGAESQPFAPPCHGQRREKQFSLCARYQRGRHHRARPGQRRGSQFSRRAS